MKKGLQTKNLQGQSLSEPKPSRTKPIGTQEHNLSKTQHFLVWILLADKSFQRTKPIGTKPISWTKLIGGQIISAGQVLLNPGDVHRQVVSADRLCPPTGYAMPIGFACRQVMSNDRLCPQIGYVLRQVLSPDRIFLPIGFFPRQVLSCLQVLSPDKFCSDW